MDPYRSSDTVGSIGQFLQRIENLLIEVVFDLPIFIGMNDAMSRCQRHLDLRFKLLSAGQAWGKNGWLETSQCHFAWLCVTTPNEGELAAQAPTQFGAAKSRRSPSQSNI